MTIAFSAPLQAGGVVILFIFRALQGVACGIMMNFIPSYINELVPKEFGSRFGIYPQIAVVLGVLVAYTTAMIITNCFGYEFLHSNYEPLIDWQAQTFWRVMLGIPNLPGLIQLLLVVTGYIPESPTYLIKKGKRDEAKKVLGIFYKADYVDKILEEKERDIDEKTD